MRNVINDNNIIKLKEKILYEVFIKGKILLPITLYCQQFDFACFREAASVELVY